MTIATYNNHLLNWYWHGRLSCLPLSLCILDCWEFFFLRRTEGSHCHRKWKPRWLIPSVISAADLLQQHEPVCLSFPFLPLARDMRCPRYLPSLLLSLLTPNSYGHCRVVRRQNLWVLVMDLQPSGEDKIRRLSHLLPHPPSHRIAKLPYELK